MSEREGRGFRAWGQGSGVEIAMGGGWKGLNPRRGGRGMSAPPTGVGGWGGGRASGSKSPEGPGGGAGGGGPRP